MNFRSYRYRCLPPGPKAGVYPLNAPLQMPEFLFRCESHLWDLNCSVYLNFCIDAFDHILQVSISCVSQLFFWKKIIYVWQIVSVMCWWSIVIQSCQSLLPWCCFYTQDIYIINWSLLVASTCSPGAAARCWCLFSLMELTSFSLYTAKRFGISGEAGPTHGWCGSN